MADPSSRPAASPGAPPAFDDPALPQGLGVSTRFAAPGAASHSHDGPAPDSFERALSELEAIVQRMESGALTLEDSLGAYRRGASLVAYCRKSLADVQQQVRVLEADLLRPFDAQPSEPGASDDSP